MFPGHGNVFVLIWGVGVSGQRLRWAFSLTTGSLAWNAVRTGCPCLPRSVARCSVGAFSTSPCSTSPGPSSHTGMTGRTGQWGQVRWGSGNTWPSHPISVAFSHSGSVTCPFVAFVLEVAHVTSAGCDIPLAKGLIATPRQMVTSVTVNLRERGRVNTKTTCWGRTVSAGSPHTVRLSPSEGGGRVTLSRHPGTLRWKRLLCIPPEFSFLLSLFFHPLGAIPTAEKLLLSQPDLFLFWKHMAEPWVLRGSASSTGNCPSGSVCRASGQALCAGATFARLTDSSRAKPAKGSPPGADPGVWFSFTPRSRQRALPSRRAVRFSSCLPAVPEGDVCGSCSCFLGSSVFLPMFGQK